MGRRRRRANVLFFFLSPGAYLLHIFTVFTERSNTTLDCLILFLFPWFLFFFLMHINPLATCDYCFGTRNTSEGFFFVGFLPIQRNNEIVL